MSAKHDQGVPVCYHLHQSFNQPTNAVQQELLNLNMPAWQRSPTVIKQGCQNTCIQHLSAQQTQLIHTATPHAFTKPLIAL